MKIGEITIGSEYGAAGRYYSYSSIPRQVKAVGIRKVEERVQSRYAYRTYTRNVRKVEVEFLDEPDPRAGSWNKIDSAKKGTTQIVSARQLLAPWAELHKDILTRAAVEQTRMAKRIELEQYFNALGFKIEYGEVRVNAQNPQRYTVEFNDKQVDKLIAMLDKGGDRG